MNFAFVPDKKSFWKYWNHCLIKKEVGLATQLISCTVLKFYRRWRWSCQRIYYFNSNLSFLGIRVNKGIIEKKYSSFRANWLSYYKITIHPWYPIYKSKLNTSTSFPFKENKTSDAVNAYFCSKLIREMAGKNVLPP